MGFAVVHAERVPTFGARHRGGARVAHEGRVAFGTLAVVRIGALEFEAAIPARATAAVRPRSADSRPMDRPLGPSEPVRV
jgi:hypothetical protein